MEEHSIPAHRRLLLLWGFMGVGKSTVGKLLADSVGASFVDLDAAIVGRAGRSITQIFDQDGEAAFRALEAHELRRCLDVGQPPQKLSVVALGGGALLSAALRTEALGSALVVTLAARPGTLARRISAGSAEADGRPLWQPGWRARLHRRYATYAESHIYLQTDDLVAPDVVSQLRDLWQPAPI